MTTFECENCPQRFSNLVCCVNHVYSHHSTPRRCVVPDCHSTVTRLALHLRKRHRDLCEYPCHDCKRVFVRDCDRQRHLNSSFHAKLLRVNYKPHVSLPTGTRSKQFINRKWNAKQMLLEISGK